MAIFSKKNCLLTAAITMALTGCNWDNRSSQKSKQPANQPLPTANAGLDSTAAEGSKVVLQGSGTLSDTAAPGLTYSWRQVSGPSVSLSDSKTPKPSFTAPQVNNTEVLTFELNVTSGTNSASDKVSISITNISAPPLAKPGAVAPVIEGEKVTLVGGFEAVADKPSVSQYRWKQVSGPAVELTGADQKNASFIAPSVSANTELTFSLVVTSDEASAPSLVKVQVLNKSAQAVAGNPIKVREGEPFELDASASKPSGEKPISSYQWRSLDASISVANTDASSPRRQLIAPAVDAEKTVQFALVVTDENGASAESLVPVTITNDGDTPVAVAQNVNTAQGVAVELNAANSTEPKNRPLQFTWTQVLAKGEAALPFTVQNGGKTISFTAPAVTQNTQLLFDVVAFNGINYSAPTRVAVDVAAEAAYSGKSVELKGNPYSTLFNRLELGYHPYNMQVVGNKAYITYHETKKNSEGKQPTGLLVVDISDEKNLKIVKNYPLAWDGSPDNKAVQLRLAVDDEGKYAYVVEKELLGAEEKDALGLVRIDLASEPKADNNGEHYLFKAPSDDPDGYQISDVVIRQGAIYAAEYTGRALFKIDPTSEPAKPTITTLWSTDTAEYSTYHQKLDVSQDGKLAVLLDLKKINVLRFDEEQKLKSAYEVKATQLDDRQIGSRHMAIDDTGESLFISFAPQADINREHFYSSVEKLDIRDTSTPAPIQHFQTTEDARGLVYSNGFAYVGGGKQGLQMINSADNELALHTYYQTPMAATAVAVNAAAKRAYVAGDTGFVIVDLQSQDTPAQSSQWSKAYMASGATTYDRNQPGRAQDVELIQTADKGIYAVVAQGADPEQKLNQLLVVQGIGTDTQSIKSVDITPFHKEKDGYIDLKSIGNDVFAFFPFANRGAIRLAGADITATPKVSAFTTDKTRGIGAAGENTVYIDHYAKLQRWFVNEAKQDTARNDIWNNEFFDIYVSPKQTHIIGIGRPANIPEHGCSVTDALGSGSTAPFVAFNSPANTEVYAGAYDSDRYVCFAGFGYDQQPSAENDEGAYSDGFGILSVAFKQSPEAIDVDPDSHSESGWKNLNPNDLAAQSIYSLPDNPEDFYRMGNRLYVADGTYGGIQIVDATDPTHLVLEGVLHTEDKANGVAVTPQQNWAVVADDNLSGIVQIPFEFPTLTRTDDDAAATNLTAEAAKRAEKQALPGATLTYKVDWTREEYNQVTCFATNDKTPFGNDSCTVSKVEGDTTAAIVTWKLPDSDEDQEIRVAVGNNIEFLSARAQIIVTPQAK